MTQPPMLPKSRRNLDDLNALIDEAIGKPVDGSMSPPPLLPSTEAQVEPASGESIAPPSQAAVVAERFRVNLDPAVIVATKLAAVTNKVAPSTIVEQALRQYLNLKM